MQSVHQRTFYCFYLNNTQLNHMAFIDSSASHKVQSIDEPGINPMIQGLAETGQKLDAPPTDSFNHLP
jgi:hypothetical protein